MSNIFNLRRKAVNAHGFKIHWGGKVLDVSPKFVHNVVKNSKGESPIFESISFLLTFPENFNEGWVLVLYSTPMIPYLHLCKCLVKVV